MISLEPSWPINFENYHCVVAAHLNYREPLSKTPSTRDTTTVPTSFRFLKLIDRLHLAF